jgi:hypothetical protein
VNVLYFVSLSSVAPICAHCNKPVVGQVVEALGQKWHPEHFVCTVCGSGFPDGKYFDKDNQPYCEKDFRAKFMTCKSCNQPITGKAVTALNSVWHPEHFACQVCRKVHFLHSSQLYTDTITLLRTFKSNIWCSQYLCKLCASF